MSLTSLSIHRPVTTLMASIIVVLLGWMALSGLSVDLMPDIQYPTVSVTTLYPGAGPEEVETLITRPLEQTLSSVSGFDRLSSHTLEGSSTIRVQFRWGTNLDTAIADMRQAIDKVRANLPDDIDPPYIRRYDVNDSPIIYLGLSSELPPIELTRLAERTIVPRLERLDGVARVGLRGEVRREIQVNVDRAKLESMQMGVNEVVSALELGNVSLPAGDFDEGHVQRLIRSRTEFVSLDEIRDQVIRRRDDAVVRVRDVAEVVDSHEEITQLTRTNGEPGIMVYIFKQAGANTIDVSDAVTEAVAEINKDVGEAQMTIRLDKSKFIRDSISNIQQSALIGMGLAMLVLVLFLRSFRSTLIIGVSMPLSVLATFVLIYFQGFTLNMVSFGGIALGIGMLVDNSIVVLESIFRKRDEGLDPKQAALQGTREVASAITASTLTTLIVFLPLIFITGLTGILLHQLAFVVCFSLICSLLASLTLTPALAAHWLTGHPLEDSSGILRWWHRGVERLHAASHAVFSAVENAYGAVIRAALRWPELAIFPILVLLAITLGLLPRVGTEFLPATDDGRLGITGTMSPGIRLETLDRQAKKVEETVFTHIPEADNVSIFIGDDADDGDDWNECRFIIQLPPRDERTVTAEDVRSRVMKEMPAIAGMKLRARVYSAMPLFRMFGSQEGDNVAVLIRGHDRATGDEIARQVIMAMESIPGLDSIELQQDDRRPELSTYVDRSKASLLDINVQDITQSLETTIRGTYATVFREDGDEFNVNVRLQEDDRRGKADLLQVGVATAGGRIVPLGNLVNFRTDDAPLAIDRLDRQRVLVVTANTVDRDLGSVVADLETALSGLTVPSDFTVEIGGDWEEQQESFAMLQAGFILAVLMMYMIMASQFESLRDPLLILVSLPLAICGVVVVFVFWDTTLNVQSFIGLVVLAGIVVNNAIVLVDYANQLRREDPQRPVVDVVVHASCRRFRPIIMTTLTTVLAMLPVALGWGEGGELQAPMARVVIGGLVSGTLMTLIAIPLVYQFFAGETDNSEDESPKSQAASPAAV
ncbi:MAG: efflux RND transporter permease subunit [Maioricimonas sp. JB045]|uniref:efflux RND transporter permease subunit n=1 Tax=Maioricimonas sp. JC845 TaxID=3232138 RepID=UPI003458200C